MCLRFHMSESSFNEIRNRPDLIWCHDGFHPSIYSGDLILDLYLPQRSFLHVKSSGISLYLILALFFFFSRKTCSFANYIYIFRLTT